MPAAARPRVIRTALVVLFVAPYAVLASMVGYPVARLFRSPRLLYALGRFGARAGLWLAGVRAVVEGAERLGQGTNTVVMSNHASHLDAALLIALLPLDFKVVVKKELYGFPFVHNCFDYVGFIKVDRGDPEQARQAVARAVAALRAGSAFLIFPEGTRSPRGELGEFKKGGFVVAIGAGSRIVPVAVQGSAGLMPKGSFLIRPGTVRLAVLDPVDAGGYSYESRDGLIGDVRSRIAHALVG